MSVAAPASATTLYDEAWDNLLSFIEERRVIPIVGRELLWWRRGARDARCAAMARALWKRSRRLDPLTVIRRLRRELPHATAACRKPGLRERSWDGLRCGLLGAASARQFRQV
jgi:hypothetical protein